MTDQERAVLDQLVAALNAFVELPIEHSDDTNDSGTTSTSFSG